MPECGARAAPARGFAIRSQAAPGIIGPALRPVWEVRSLDWDKAGAGNARFRNARSPCPGWRGLTGSNVPPRPRKPGLELRPRAERPNGKSRGGTPTGERPPPFPPPRAGEGGEGVAAVPQHGIMRHASVGVPLPLGLSWSCVMISESQATVAGESGRRSIQAGFSRSDKQNSGAHASRERCCLSSLPGLTRQSMVRLDPTARGHGQPGRARW